MADTHKYVSVKPTRLTTGASSSDTSISVAAVQDIAGESLAFSDFGSTEVWGVFEPDSSSRREFCRITAISSTTLTVERGIKPKAPYDADTSTYAFAHASGTRFIIMTNAPAFYDTFVNKDNDESISGTYTFTGSLPKQNAYSAPTADEEFAPKRYVDDTATGTTSINRIVPKAIAGETVAAGEIVYFDTTDNEWKLADASATATADKILLGIAQGAGTNGNAISGGVLLDGLDSNQSGMTQGDIMYLSDTAGAIASSAGTVEVAIGIAYDADELYFAPRFNRTLTEADFDKVEAITASASELNTMNGITATTAQLNEAGTFFGSTDISASEAETLTDGSLADSLHSHELFEIVKAEQDANTETTVIIDDFEDFTENLTGSSIIRNQLTETIVETDNSSGADAIIERTISIDSGNAFGTTIVFDQNQELTFRGQLSDNTSQDIFMGLYGDTLAEIPADATSTTKHAGFYIEDGTLNASIADGTTQETSQINGITLTNKNTYHIIFVAGTRVEFYVNGSLEATLNTNVPSGGGSVRMTFGVTTQANDHRGIKVENNVAYKLTI